MPLGRHSWSSPGKFICRLKPVALRGPSTGVKPEQPRCCGEDIVRKIYTAASLMALATAMGAGSAFAQAPASRAAPLPGADVVLIYGDRIIQDPGAYSVIGTEDIQAVEANHPAEILNTVPGVNVQMNSGQELLVAIRSPVLPGGAGQGSFLILENGVPTRASAFGNV